MLRRAITWSVAAATAMLATGGGVFVGSQQRPAADPAPAAASRALISQYCAGCHNEKVTTAGLAMNTLDVENVGEHAEVWEKVVRKLRARAMPPAGRPRPDEAGYDALVSYLETSLDRVALAKPNPGRTDAFRRLNRTEYRNAIRDLLALDVDVDALLPKDDASFGFDNVAIGGLSPTLMERYLSAAQKIGRLAIGTPVRAPGGEFILVPPDVTQEDHFEGLPFGTRGGTAVRHNFPMDGEYEIQIRLARDRNEQIEGLSEQHTLDVAMDGSRLRRFTLNPVPRGAGTASADYYAEDKGDAGLKLRIPVKAGPRELAVTFLKRPSAILETERQPYEANFNLDRHPRSQPALYSISIAGPFDPSGVGDTPSRRRIFVCRPAAASEEGACARQILSSLARRAYRRAVTDADLKVLLSFYEKARAERGFEAGIETALRSLLVSPQFLFRIEQDPAGIPPNTAYRISDVELASRLSFFLWNSIPDDELLDLAIQGKLKEPAVLEQQVRRMLADSRSETLVTNFAGQWLYLRNLAAVSPDPRLFPDFDDNLRQAFRRETELFFESIVKEDRSVLKLLDADYTFVNERLAKHYKIPNVYGSRFRRVALEAGSVRGGLLGHGSILTVTSYANRTSPVLRGKWVLENILGIPPPPPPANVPPLKEDAGSGKVLTMRERMVEHRANPTCASCHQLMDPVGLSMENFDAIGRLRAKGEDGSAVDATGGLPDGSSFNGTTELRQALLKRPELFVTTLSEKLLTYAAGRGLDYYDAAAVRKITSDARSKDYRFSSLILGTVNSTPFLMRRSQ